MIFRIRQRDARSFMIFLNRQRNSHPFSFPQSGSSVPDPLFLWSLCFSRERKSRFESFGSKSQSVKIIHYGAHTSGLDTISWSGAHTSGLDTISWSGAHTSGWTPYPGLGCTLPGWTPYPGLGCTLPGWTPYPGLGCTLPGWTPYPAMFWIGVYGWNRNWTKSKWWSQWVFNPSSISAWVAEFIQKLRR